MTNVLRTALTIALAASLDRADDVSVPVKPGVGGPASGSAALADIGLAPAIHLTDQNGEPFRSESLRGKAVLVSFVFTTCTGTCPATTFGLSRVKRVLEREGLWGTKVAFVSITLDPGRDTPEALRNYARTYGASAPAWRFLTGREADVSAVHRAWGMWAKPLPSGQIDHPSRIFLVDPAGHQREIYNLEFLEPTSVARDIRRVLEAPVTPG